MSAPQQAGYLRQGMIDVPGGRVWYGMQGEGAKPPLLTVHGGPGFPHIYLLPSMTEFAGLDRRPVVFYDQLGCGKSQRPADPSLWTVERYRRELECVVASLRLDRFHLWGHSWGTQLALNYAATRPRGLLSLSLAGPVFDIPSYRRDLDHLLGGHPPAVQEALRNQEPGSEPYRHALDRFYAAHLHRSSPLPDSWRMAFSEEQFGAESYNAMVGPDEFHYTGLLREVDDSPLLAEVAVPVWFHCGRTDLALPQRCEKYANTIPGSRLTVFENSSHAFFDEERPQYLAALRDFLADHDPPAGIRAAFSLA